MLDVISYSKAKKVEEDLVAHKEDYANQQITLENEIINGDFSDGTNGWNVEIPSNIHVDNGQLVVNFSHQFHRLYQNLGSFKIGDSVYSKMSIKSGDLKHLHLREGSTGSFSGKTTVTDTNEEFVDISFSGVIESDTNMWLTLQERISSNFQEVRIKEPLSINTTKSFGIGNEPTKEEVDILIDQIGWFDGERVLTLGEINKWQMAVNRKRYENVTNAIIELGGTI